MTGASARLEVSTPELDEAERAWWREFADVEERYCWVQTPAVQRILRGHYVRRIEGIARERPRVVELGCGSGWLSLRLAQSHRADVTGVDWSPEQLEIARERAYRAGHAGRLRYVQGDEGLLVQAERFDLVIMHGFLHHLSRSEIGEVLGKAAQMLATGGCLVALEPVQYPPAKAGRGAEGLIHRQQWLAGLQNRGRRFRWRRFSDAERAARNKIDRRGVGQPPFGPAPKELPFGPEELPKLLAPAFELVDRQRCMSMSHLVAQEYLLFELSHPWLGALVKWPILLWAARLDRRLVALDPPPPGVWIFELFEARPRFSGGGG